MIASRFDTNTRSSNGLCVKGGYNNYEHKYFKEATQRQLKPPGAGRYSLESCMESTWDGRGGRHQDLTALDEDDRIGVRKTPKYPDKSLSLQPLPYTPFRIKASPSRDSFRCIPLLRYIPADILLYTSLLSSHSVH
jgi:hypothetical protein